MQEVIAAARFLKAKDPELDAAVELGGEDAKLLYLKGGVELRMNEACAGGTGAFIDQMASLLDTDAAGLNRLALEAETSHPIAVRSVMDAVAEQTVSGLACGRPVKGRIAFLGGPLSFLYCLYVYVHQAKVFWGPRLRAIGAALAIRWFEHLRGVLRRALQGTPVGRVPTLREEFERIDGLVDAGLEAGEGWNVTNRLKLFLAQAREIFAAAQSAPFRPALTALPQAPAPQPGAEGAARRVIPITPVSAAGSAATGRRPADAGGQAACSAPHESTI